MYKLILAFYLMIMPILGRERTVNLQFPTGMVRFLCERKLLQKLKSTGLGRQFNGYAKDSLMSKAPIPQVQSPAPP